MKTTALQNCKIAGLKNLKELSELTGRSVNTLRNYSDNFPGLFEIILLGAAEKKIQFKR